MIALIGLVTLYKQGRLKQERNILLLVAAADLVTFTAGYLAG